MHKSCPKIDRFDELLTNELRLLEAFVLFKEQDKTANDEEWNHKTL